MGPRALLPLCLLLAACTAAPAEGEGATQALIVNGKPSTSSQDATVLLTLGTGGGFCTGALIAPNLVLTARHCVQEVDPSAECSPFTTRLVASTITVSLGAAAGAGAVAARGKQTFVDQGTDICSHDLALIELDREVAGAKIATLRLDRVKAGEKSTAVGYGDDGSGTPTNGRYQRTSLEIDAVGPASHTYTTKENEKIAFTVHAGEIATGESTCFGDSGGPLFDAEGNVIGVTSRGLDEKCVDRPSIFSDTASHAKLIEAAAKAAGQELSIASAADDSAADTSSADDEANDEAATPHPKSKAKSGSTATPQANAGCSLAAPGREMHGAELFALVALAALAARRRRSMS
jgi:MYXO-CTERM domain-containing protein